MRGRFVTWLSVRHLPVWTAAIAVLLTLPSLGGGLVLDDYHYRLVMMDPENPNRCLHSRIDLFRFIDGPEEMDHWLELGIAPWWTGCNSKAAFWRPLSSLFFWTTRFGPTHDH